jgi:hypothetical protein
MTDPNDNPEFDSVLAFAREAGEHLRAMRYPCESHPHTIAGECVSASADGDERTPRTAAYIDGLGHETGWPQIAPGPGRDAARRIREDATRKAVLDEADARKVAREARTAHNEEIASFLESHPAIESQG